MADRASGAIIREARRLAGLSQVELGLRSGVTQSVISAYESGTRQPSLPLVERLVRAAGCALEVGVRLEAQHPFAGPLGQKLLRHRREIRDITAQHGLSNVRVFGSVARGDETADSDVDLLVDVSSGVGLLGLARCQRDLEALLNAPVDLIPSDHLKSAVALSVLPDVQLL